MVRTLIESSRWLLLVSLVYAPWAYGCTVPWAGRLLDGFLSTVILLWVTGLAVQQKRPSIAGMPLVCVVLLLCQGGFMVWNAHFQHDEVLHQFRPVASLWPRLPGAIDQIRSAAALFHIAVILGVFLIVCDLARRKMWRRRIIGTMALAGLSIVVLGLFQKVSNASLPFWQAGNTDSPFFGTFFYHGNAGAFINLVLPLIAALASRSFFRSQNDPAEVLWIPSLLLCLAAAVVNVSRAASLITVLLVCLLVTYEVRRFLRMDKTAPRLPIAAGVIFVLASTAAISVSAGATQAWQKWGMLEEQLNENNPRFVAVFVCVSMAKDSGFWGFGPGTFEIAFPHYTNGAGTLIAGVWRFAHEDYLQTIIEWGWFGGGLWGLLFFGAIFKSLFASSRGHRDSRSMFVCGMALSGAAIHAVVDFPLQIPSLQLYIATLAGIAWSGCPPKTPAG